MTYCAKQDLIDRFGEKELAALTDRDIGEIIDEAVLNRAIADAESEINTYLQAKYTLPLASVPPILTAAACDLTRFYLYEDAVTEAVQKRYDGRIAWLKDLAAGRASLGLDGAGQETATESGTVDYTANERLFTGDSLADF